MPIYEFHCEQCEADSEILVRSSSWRGTKCPHCGSAKLTKKLSTFASSATASGTSPAPPTCMAKSGGCGCGRAGAHRH